MKKNIFLSDQAAAFFAALNINDERQINWSNSVNSNAHSLRVMIAENLPELTTVEWNTLLGAYNGCFAPTEVERPRIASDLLDDKGVEPTEKGMASLSDEYRALVVKCSEMSLSTQYAVLYVCQCFWRNRVKLASVLNYLSGKEDELSPPTAQSR